MRYELSIPPDGLPLFGETLVYDPRSRTAYRLPRVAPLVFRHADGETPVAVVVALLAKEAGSEEAARSLLLTLLAKLARKGLLETAERLPPPSRGRPT